MSWLLGLRAFAGCVPRTLARRRAQRLLAQTADVRTVQRRLLLDLLRLNAGSVFSRERRLDAVRTVADFRRSVPISGYEAHRPYIERLALGEHDALLGPRNRLLMFSLSSGTTDLPKYIPITDRFLRDYRLGWHSWGIRTLDAHPRIPGGTIVQLVGDHESFRTPGGIPCGQISGLVASMQPAIVRSMYAVPREIAGIRDSESKFYAALRFALADPHVRFVLTANPGTLVHLAKLADRDAEFLIRDIRDGTLRPDLDVPDAVRSALARTVRRRDPVRARELDRIRERTGRLAPHDVWPELELVSVWTGGSAGAWLDQLRRLYRGLPLRDHGLSASEGRMTTPLVDECAAGVLEVGVHFYEFVPEEQYGSDDPDVLEAHELQAGRNYYILLTTASGLHRYDICDVVRCTGFHDTAPLLEFLHKGAHIANVAGEKLTESQVVAAVRERLARRNLRLDCFTVCPEWDDPPRYRLLAEESPELGNADFRRLAADVDDELGHRNCEYRQKRDSGRLAALECGVLPVGTFARFASRKRQRTGSAVEQYKHPYLVPQLDFVQQVESLSADAPASQGTAGSHRLERPHGKGAPHRVGLRAAARSPSPPPRP